MIPYGRHDIDQADIDAVIEVLRSDRLTQGPVAPRFERAVAAQCGARHAVAANSATSSLHIACLAVGLKQGDRLWTVPNTFVASANCGRYCGADVDFVDIDAHMLNISIPLLRDKLVNAKRAGGLPAVLVPVDFGGQPVDLQEIVSLAKEYDFRVIEDASHAIGASRNCVPVGTGADVTIFSFHPVKIITTAEGGVGATDDPELAWKMELLRNHGVTRDADRFTEIPTGPWYYEQLDLGFNYRLTDLHAALGLSQLAKLDRYVDRRNELAERYQKLLAGLPLSWQRNEDGYRSAYHLFVVRLDSKRAKRNRLDVFNALVAGGIGANVHYMPVHLQPYYRKLGFTEGQYPEAEAYAAEAITLPLYPTMTEGDQDHVVSVLRSALG